MLRKSLIALMGISALTLGAQPVLATVLGNGGTHVNQSFGATDTTLVTNLSGTSAIYFSTTTTNTKIWVSVTGSCTIAYGSTPDYVDIDVLIDGVEIGPSTDNAFCTAPMYQGVMAAGNFVGNVSAAGTHTVTVRAKQINGNGGAPTSQAGIHGLSVVVSK